MGDVPILWWEDGPDISKAVGKFDLDQNEIVIWKPMIMGGPEYELIPMMKITESTEVDGVTFIQKAKLLALTVVPTNLERVEE